jgi:hypothetical protein
VQQFLRRHRPDLHAYYRGVLFDASARRQYERQLDARIRKARKAAGL